MINTFFKRYPYSALEGCACSSGCATSSSAKALEKVSILKHKADETAQNRLEQMIPQLAKEAGATEELKASDPMKWVGLMNTCKAQAEEILMAELINS